MGQRLSELRRRAGLTQEALARRADVGTDAVRNWEKGRRTPGLDMAVKLADALDITLDELAGREPRRKKGGKQS
jgi:transcriptional regulator with XRE-family HTH domain